jgi:conjugal transfer/entry exclusion protein
MRRWGLLLILFVALSWPRMAQAQGLPVYDNANFIQNVIQAVQLVLSVANQVLELTRLGSIALDATYTQDLNDLTLIIQQAQGLSFDLNSLNSQITTLFGLSTAPTSTRQLATRMTQIRQLIFDAHVYAMRTQTLIQTTIRTLRRLAAITGAISRLVGNMQGNQTATQLEGTLAETLTRLQVQTAAYERANSVEKLSEPLVHKSMENITQEVMADWPRRRP